MQMQYIHFDIIYENDGQNGENYYRRDPFLVKTQLDGIEYRFTKMNSLVVGLPVVPPKLLIFLKEFFLYFTCCLLGFDPFLCGFKFSSLIFIPRIKKDFSHSFIIVFLL